MIIKNKTVHISDIFKNNCLADGNNKEVYKKALFFDLEHYVYKKPICVGVFGCGYYNDELSQIELTQYMIENEEDANEILKLAEKYFFKAKNELNKEYVVTFSGNNDFTMINYLFEKNNIDIKVNEYFKSVDLQKEYEKISGKCIGLKNLEKIFCIPRETELISGATLAKTFAKIIKDNEYFERMPEEKVEKILSYNEQDVTSLFYIMVNWYEFTKNIKKEDCK